MMRALIATLIAWAVGFWAYSIALDRIWHQAVAGDADAVMGGSAIALGVAVPLVYWPAMRFLRRCLHGYRPFVLFPLAAALISVVPTALIFLFECGPLGLAGLFSPEAGLFYIFFGVAGVVLGTAFAAFRAAPTNETIV